MHPTCRAVLHRSSGPLLILTAVLAAVFIPIQGATASTPNSSPAPSRTVATATPMVVTVADPVLYSATVTGTGGVPTGSVVITFGLLPVGAMRLVNGTGTFITNDAPIGTDKMLLTYSGDKNFAPSSTTITLDVKPPVLVTHGYWLVGSDGGIFSFGSALFHGSAGSLHLQRPVVGITPTLTDGGYWLVASDGGIFSYGNSGYYGSIPGVGLAPAGADAPRRLNAPIVGMVPTSDGKGYFMVASDGGVFAFGDAKFEGSCPGIGGCSGTAVSVMPDSTGSGYWLVTNTGRVYPFGDAANYGEPGQQSTPITSAASAPYGHGYWILDAAGQVFAFGTSPFGSVPGGAAGGLNPATAIFTTGDGAGYWVATADGNVFDFGNATNQGNLLGDHLNGPIIAATGW